MKRTLTLAALVVTALSAASIAVARGLDDSKNARSVTGTFTATTASHLNTRTCTTPDNKALVVTDGTYTGTASGDPDLTGNATLHAHSVINTTDGVGRVTGTLRIDVSGRDTQAQFDSVYSGGSIAGLAVGHAHDPAARLVANVSAGFTGTGGFTDGKLGGSSGGAAVELTPGTCRPMRTIKEHSAARGTVSANTGSSITVAGLMCAVPSALQAKVGKFPTGSRAEIRCTLVSGTNTLDSITR
ncbi:MAG TPA: hypothetical protein VF091_06820 [Gaiellaceae bacterium]